MSVPISDRRKRYTCLVGSTGPYPITFPVLIDPTTGSAQDVSIYLIRASGTITDITATCTVTGLNVYTPDTYTDEDEILLIRETPRTQETDYTTGDTFDGNQVERDFDKDRYIDIEMQEEIDRCLHPPITENAPSMELPSIENRKDLFLAFNSEGKPVAAESTVEATPVTPWAKTLLDDVSAAIARATLGLGTAAVEDAGTGNGLNADQVDGADLDTNTALGDSDNKIPSQKAVKTYIDNQRGDELPLGTIVFWDKSFEAKSKTKKSTGTADTDTATCLEDSGATFQTDGVAAGDIVWNTTDDVPATVVSVDSETKITLDYDAFPDGDEAYDIYDEPDVQPGWIEMDGSTINDPDSPFDGMTITDVIGEERFIRARQTAGRLQADAIGDHYHLDGSGNNAGARWGNTTSSASQTYGYSSATRTNARNTSSPYGFEYDTENRPVNISAIPLIKIKLSTSTKLATYYSIDGDNFADLSYLSTLADDDRLVVWDESSETYQYTEIEDVKAHLNLPDIQAGKANNGLGWQTVTFDRAFASIPVVVATGDWESGSSNDEYGVTVDDVSTTGFKFYTWNYDGSNHSNTVDRVNWIAIVT